MVVAVVNELKSALGAVDDMQQWLTVLNLKMQHMRDDIAAIEQRNNALEIQSNNEQLLLKELQALLETIDTPPSLKDIGEIEALSLEVCKLFVTDRDGRRLCVSLSACYTLSYTGSILCRKS